MAETRPDLRALIDRLENYYDFECTGGPLRNCVEWQQLKEAALSAPAAVDESWREQDEALQAICRECGDDEHVSCSADVVTLVRRTLADRSAPVPPTPEDKLVSIQSSVRELEAAAGIKASAPVSPDSIIDVKLWIHEWCQRHGYPGGQAAIGVDGAKELLYCDRLARIDSGRTVPPMADSGTTP